MAGVTAPSHIYPSLAVIAELVRRGHRGHATSSVSASPRWSSPPARPSSAPSRSCPTPTSPGRRTPARRCRCSSTTRSPRCRRSKDCGPPDAVLYDIGGYGGRRRGAPVGRPRGPALADLRRLGGLRGGHGRVQRRAEGLAERRALLRDAARLARRARRRDRRRHVPRPPRGVRRADPARAAAQRGPRVRPLRVRRPVRSTSRAARLDATARRRPPARLRLASAPPTPTAPTSTRAASTSSATTTGS